MTLAAVKNTDISFRKEFRKRIFDAQDLIGTLPQAEPPVFHHFGNGSYAREMHIEAGVILVGKIHRHSHPNVLSKGKVSVSSEFGTETFEAPRTWVSEPGIKRMIYAHEDAVWTTFHVTDSVDLDEIEKELIAESYNELEE